MIKSILALCLLIPLLANAAPPQIDQAVYDRLAKQATVPVMVVFELESILALKDSEQLERSEVIAAVGDSIIAQAGPGFQVTHRYQRVSALAGRIDRHALAQLQSHPDVRLISTDVGGSGHLDVAIPLLGMDVIQQAAPLGLGIDGTGIKVVVMDTGIEAAHEDFDGALLDEACFCANPNGDCCPNGQASQFGTGSAADDHGHGTWVSSHILGRGNIAHVGAAPAASVVAVKVLDANNSFNSTADITAAFDWIAVNHPDADVVNASLGTFFTTDVECGELDSGVIRAMRDAIQAVNANGTVVIASTGNQGLTGIQLPSCLREVIAVGATWKEDTQGSFSFPFFTDACPDSQVDPRLDEVACFSNTSPQLDLLAPGVNMNASGLGNSTINGISGTSFAAPLVAGCAALIRQAYPELAIDDVRRQMTNSNIMVSDDRNDVSRPRLNCERAIQISLFMDRFES